MAATVAQLKDRIVTMWGQVSGIVTSADDYLPGDATYTAAQLPAAVTRPIQIRATRTRIGAGVYRVRREFTTILHVSLVSTVSALTPDTTQMELCETYLITGPEYFLAHSRLEHNDSGLAFGTEPMSDSGVIRIVREGADYWGILFTLPVITVHNH